MPDTIATLLHGITDLGDSAVLSLVVLCFSFYLLAYRCRREAGALVMAYLLAMVTAAFSKLAMLDCVPRSTLPMLHSPSGHTALSLAVFETIGIIAYRQIEGRRRWLPVLASSLLAISIGLTRVALDYHTVAEILAGFAIGGACIAAGWLSFLHNRTPGRFGLRRAALIVVCIGLIFSGLRVPGERMLVHFAAQTQAYNPCRSK